MRPPAEPPKRMGTVLIGIARVARGRKDGLLHFGDSAHSVLAALTPFVAFLLVGSVLSVISGKRDFVEYMAVLTILVLAPLVISFEFARRWGRAGQWFRFATAFCWCQWTGPMVLFAMALLAAILMAGGVGENAANSIALLCMSFYVCWLQWFLIRHGLELSVWRAIGLTLGLGMLTMVLIYVPALADYAVNGPPPS